MFNQIYSPQCYCFKGMTAKNVEKKNKLFLSRLSLVSFRLRQHCLHASIILWSKPLVVQTPHIEHHYSFCILVGIWGHMLVRRGTVVSCDK